MVTQINGPEDGLSVSWPNPGIDRNDWDNHKKEYLLRNWRGLIQKVSFGLDGQNGTDAPDRHSTNVRSFVLSQNDENWNLIARVIHAWSNG